MPHKQGHCLQGYCLKICIFDLVVTSTTLPSMSLKEMLLNQEKCIVDLTCLLQIPSSNQLVCPNVPQGCPGDSVVKNQPATASDMRHGFDAWVGKILWRRKWQPTPIFLPGNFHGQRSLTGYSPRGRQEWDMTEHTHTQSHNRIMLCLNCVKGRPHSAEVPRRHPRCPSPQLALSQLEPQGHSDWRTCHPAFCHCSYRI